MTYPNQQNQITASHLMIVLFELFPDSTYGAVPVVGEYHVLEAYFQRTNGVFETNPGIKFPIPKCGS